MAKEWTDRRPRDRKFTVAVQHPSECKRVLSIEIPVEELQMEEQRVLGELKRDLRVPGFRKGKVPPRYIQKNYQEVIHSDAVRNLLPEVYELALVREGITPIGEPRFDKVQAEAGETVTFEVTVEVRPEIEVKGYKKVKVKAKRAEIDEGRVDHALEHLRESLAKYRVVVDREVREGDLVVIDYGPLPDNGELDEARMTRNHSVDLAGGSLLEEFRTGLLGMEIGGKKDIRVRYPEDFPEEDVRGTEKTFRVIVKEIKERELPEVNDDFARGVGEQFEDLNALRAQIKEDLTKDEEKRYQHDVEERIIDKLIESNPFEVPEAMVNNYFASVLEEDRRRRPHVPEEEREKEVRERFREAAVRTIRKYFIIEAIKVQEGIEVDDAEIDARIEELARGSSERSDEVRHYFRHPERRRSLKNDLTDRKVLTFLRDVAEVKEAA